MSPRLDGGREGTQATPQNATARGRGATVILVELSVAEVVGAVVSAGIEGNVGGRDYGSAANGCVLARYP